MIHFCSSSTSSIKSKVWARALSFWTLFRRAPNCGPLARVWCAVFKGLQNREIISRHMVWIRPAPKKQVTSWPKTSKKRPTSNSFTYFLGSRDSQRYQGCAGTCNQMCADLLSAQSSTFPVQRRLTLIPGSLSSEVSFCAKTIRILIW